MKTKEFLRKIRDLDNQIQTLIEEQEGLWARMTSTTVQAKEVNIQNSSDGDSMTPLMAKYLELRELINAEIDRYIDMKLEAQRIIFQMPNLKHRELIVKYYFQNKSFEVVAVEMSYSWRRIMQLHGDALADFERIREENRILFEKR